MLRLLQLSSLPQGRQRSFPLHATPRKVALCRDPLCIALLCNTVEPEAALSNPIAAHESSDHMADAEAPERRCRQPHLPDLIEPAVSIAALHACWQHNAMVWAGPSP